MQKTAGCSCLWKRGQALIPHGHMHALARRKDEDVYFWWQWTFYCGYDVVNLKTNLRTSEWCEVIWSWASFLYIRALIRMLELAPQVQEYLVRIFLPCFLRSYKHLLLLENWAFRPEMNVKRPSSSCRDENTSFHYTPFKMIETKEDKSQCQMLAWIWSIMYAWTTLSLILINVYFINYWMCVCGWLWCVSVGELLWELSQALWLLTTVCLRLRLQRVIQRGFPSMPAASSL